MRTNSPVIANAFLSLSDKRGAEELALGLAQQGVNLYSTGGTYEFLLKKGVSIKPLEKIAPFPEILAGRVKSLQPEIYGGILFERDNEEHLKTMEKRGIIPIDLVVVNLYPFEEKVGLKKSHAEIMENIDIGGVTLLRAAAKNHRWVTVLCQKEDYETCLGEMQAGGNTSLDFRKKLALRAFSHTLQYEQAIFQYLSHEFAEPSEGSRWNLNYRHSKPLKYGENPHQKAEFLFDPHEKNHLSLANLEVIQGGELSYNNYLDIEAGLKVLEDYDEDKLVAIIKHQNPCGIGLSDDLAKSLQLAWEGDLVSAFGSIIVLNGEVGLEVSAFLKKKFVEIIVAQQFTPEALQELKKKKVKVVQFRPYRRKSNYEYKIVAGGVLKQEKNDLLHQGLTLKNRGQAAKALTVQERKLFDFSIKAVKKMKSNAIALGFCFKEGEFMLLGMGSGQPNRLDAMKIALEKAEGNLKRLFPGNHREKLPEAVLVSDAFFPFKDNIELAKEFGIKQIIEPGGSVRDLEVIQACEKYEINLYFSKVRHFYH